MATPDLPFLYVITDRNCASRGVGTVEEAVRRAVDAGAHCVQYRDKDLRPIERWRLGGRLGEILEGADARWLVNGRADLAAALGADGVHRPGDGLPVAALREVIGQEVLVGVSAHDRDELEAAEREGADFATLSPVFPPGSKSGEVETLGLQRFERLVEGIELPVLALGGISPERVEACLDAGADGIGVVSGVMAADRPADATRAYLDALNRVSVS